MFSLERLDRLHHGTQPGETGPLVQRLQSYGRLQGYVAGNWGEGSQDLHSYIQTCAEARVAHLTRASGRQETERLLGTTVVQFLRLVCTTIVRGAGHVPDLPGQPHHPGRQGCCRTLPGLCEVGGTAEEREEGTVDGVSAGAWLGSQGQLPQHLVICSRRSICVCGGDLTM